MADWQILGVTAVAILGIVVLIVRFHVNPVIALVIGGAFLGLASGMGITDTTDTLMLGFGDIMAEVGLLIGWGVLMGAVLNRMGAIQRLVGALMKAFGPRGVPYALGLTIGTALQSIFLDVLLVMTAPLARRIAPRLGRNGVGKISAAMAISLECGIVLMVPGVATLALAGLLSVPLGTMLLAGLAVIVPTIVVSIFIMNVAFDHGFWDPEKDQQPLDEVDPGTAATPEAQAGTPTAGAGDTSDAEARPEGDDGARVAVAQRTSTDVDLTEEHEGLPRYRRRISLPVMFAPMLIALLLIAGGAAQEMASVNFPPLTFLSTPVIALLIGLLGTIAIGRMAVGGNKVTDGMREGISESGQILLLTGAGGSLAAVVASGGLGELLGDYFTATTFAPLIVVWVMAAVLHIAVGSVSISAITAAGILAPVAPAIGLNPVLIALAAGAGSLFLVHVTSNTFWLLQSMLGQTTRGTLKTCSVGVSVASVVALLFTLVLSLFL